MTKFVTCIFMLIATPMVAQFSYKINQEVPVLANGDTLNFAWAGGLNSPQYNTIDLNNDNQEDLVLFDRTSNKLLPFVVENGKYTYRPELQTQFPAGIQNWMLLRDFNCDGKKDIFAHDPRGVVVYVNITQPKQPLKWRIFNQRDDKQHLLTQGFNSVVNLKINSSDLPAISDIDNDGDLDILTYKPSGSSTVEFHKNLSMERDGNCDSLQYEKVTQTWGEYEECQCGQFAFNGADCPPSSGREVHQGGKSLLSIDLDGNDVRELLISEEECTELFALTNSGTRDDALITSASNTFPNATNPARLFVFPAAYYEDVDMDGVRDLMVAPNLAGNVGSSVNFQSSSWFYKNTGTNSNPDFSLIKKNFLQDEMIDLGENAAPAFADLDGDGDQDMLTGSYLQFEDLGFRSSLALYENVGSPTSPAFQKSDNDYMLFSTFNFINLKPKFRDVNADDKIDLVFSATSLNSGSTAIYYLLNKSSNGFDFEGEINQLFVISNTFPNHENFELYDINQDDLPDLFIGRISGKLEYYENIGTGEIPEFELQEEPFYGLDFNLFRQTPAITIEDLNGDTAPDMLIGDAGGNLIIFDNFLSHLDDPQKGIEKLFVDGVSGDSTSLRLGSRLFPTAVDLFNSDKPALVIGSGEGGLILLENENSLSNPIFPIKGDLFIYPNPIYNNQLLNIAASKAMLIDIISISGQVIFKGLPISAGEILKVDISTFKSGVYAVVGSGDKIFETKRLIVIK